MPQLRANRMAWLGASVHSSTRYYETNHLDQACLMEQAQIELPHLRICWPIQAVVKMAV